MEQRPEDTPFYFWIDTSEPNRPYEKGIGIRAGKKIENVTVSEYLPDTPEVRSDLLDYAVEIECLIDILTLGAEEFKNPFRDAVYFGRERHSSSRWNNLGYPQRAIRTHQYLYIRNFTPERWPAGSPRSIEDGQLTPLHSGYYDIDASPSLNVMTEKYDDPYYNKFLHLSVSKRPAEELYDIQNDPGCINNLALHPDYEKITRSYRNRLLDKLEATRDPRVITKDDVWESYPRLRGQMREFKVPFWAD